MKNSQYYFLYSTKISDFELAKNKVQKLFDIFFYDRSVPESVIILLTSSLRYLHPNDDLTRHIQHLLYRHLHIPYNDESLHIFSSEIDKIRNSFTCFKYYNNNFLLISNIDESINVRFEDIMTKTGLWSKLDYNNEETLNEREWDSEFMQIITMGQFASCLEEFDDIYKFVWFSSTGRIIERNDIHHKSKILWDNKKLFCKPIKL